MTAARTLTEALSAVQRYPLIAAPTPIDRLRCAIPGFEGRVFLKRDDSTGFAMGGNKGRKLEYTMADAIAKGATTLVTASGVQSNHVRQTAAGAARAGLSFHAILTPALDTYPAAHLESGNMLLDMLFGAVLHLAPTDADVDPVTARVMAGLEARGERPYLVPLGASDGIGSLGYVACALELRAQCAASGITPSAIFVATGSGGTHAGLLAGTIADGWDVPVVGISVSEPAAIKRDRVQTAIGQIGPVLRRVIDCPPGAIVVHDGYAGEGYARPTTAANDWIRAVARADGVLLDPVYTGKSFAGMADLLGRGAFGGDVIFLHTGGAPALFADPTGIVTVERDAAALAPLLPPRR